MTVTVRDLMTDAALLGEQFAGDSWSRWRALLCGFYGLPLDVIEGLHWAGITGGRALPTAAHDELWLVVGRRGGKSQAAALLAVLESAFFDQQHRLSPGEVATVMLIAADRRQARTLMRYVSGLLHSNAMLSRLIERETGETIELANRTCIEITTASFRSVRGYTLLAAICDELAFWRSEDSANPDHEIIAALRPALATLGGKLVALSSPHGKRGELFNAHTRYFGKNDASILVAQAPTLTMNPSLPQRVVDEAYQRDAAAAAAEYGAQFRTDIASLLNRETVENALRPSPLELPYDRRNTYAAFIDPSGGGRDEFTMAIGHRDHDANRIIIDVLRARRGTPADITAEYAAILRDYGITTARADRYAGSWPADEFARLGITVEPSDQAKSGLYIDTLAALNSGQVELPPDDRMVVQFTALERRTARGGRDSVDHPPGGHDDRANAVAGLIAHARTAPYFAPSDYALII